MNSESENNDRNDVHPMKAARSAGHVIRIVIIVALLAALVALVLDNTEDVPIGYVFGDTTAPVWIVLLIAAAAGVVIGWLFKHRSRNRH